MQIRLTVLAPRSGHAGPGQACDVLVTAPAGTALATVASGLASAVSGPDASSSGPVVLYAGRERLDAQRSALGEPPLVDGAVLSLQVPMEDAAPDGHTSAARLHVVSGPDAGGVHLLHGGRIAIGRSADADVPLDDPDVSRLHCAVTLTDDGRVAVADLGSTNGTTIDGTDVGERPVRLAPGALLRIGESALRLTPGAPVPSLPLAPDGEGHLRVTRVAGSVPAPRACEPADGPPPHRRIPAPRRDEGAPAAMGHPSGGETDLPQETGHGWGNAPGLRTAGHDNGPAGAPGPDMPPQRTGHTYGTAPGFAQAQEEDLASRRQGTPPRGTRIPGAAQTDKPRRGIGAWARRLAGGWAEPATGEPQGDEFHAGAAPIPETWPDPAALLLTALGPGPRLWERGPAHPEALAVRLGTADRAELAAVPVTVGLREVGSLGLAGPRARLAGLSRSAVAQLAALHSPADLEIVLISTGRRVAEWGWLGWLPHVRPGHGQDCRLLLAYDQEQAAARTAELVRRLEDGPLGSGWAHAGHAAVKEAARRHSGPYTVVIVDGDPGSAALRETTARLAAAGAAAGIHLICLAETSAASPVSPVAETYEAACAAAPAFRECGAVGLLSGDVATALRVLRTAGGRPAGHGTVAMVDAVSAAWAERFSRALAPLRAEGRTPGDARAGRPQAVLPPSARLLDELGLARATPASLMTRWATAAEGTAVLGAGSHGPVTVDLAAEGPHLLVEGPAGSGRTELLRTVVASLAAAARPDRLGLVLVDGAGGERGEGLHACTELPHVSTHLVASDPVRMREFAQALGAELKRRAELLGGLGFAEWHAHAEASGRLAGPRGAKGQRGDLDPPPSRTLRLRPAASRTQEPEPEPLPRLVVLVDDFDALVAPALGSPGRPAAGSVVRALEAVARDGGRLGVHLVATTARPDRTAGTELARGVRLRITLDAPPAAPAAEEPSPGRGGLHRPDGTLTPFQGGRVTGRIPRTATLRPTVVPLEWERMGDPPARRPVRELGNGPTDLALLASALDRAARSVDAAPTPSLMP
ncbi:hypothetical protein GCM10020367_25610 [Streptomyces sannanensis]|uniref:FHA domain-containing protein n=1 Tax=Streptomyces sannanensis TaxID=285536 RepID=A0ABP6SAL3_9ACTN